MVTPEAFGSNTKKSEVPIVSQSRCQQCYSVKLKALAPVTMFVQVPTFFAMSCTSCGHTWLGADELAMLEFAGMCD